MTTRSVPRADLIEGNSRRATSIWRRWWQQLIGPPWKLERTWGDLVVDQYGGDTPGIGSLDNSPQFVGVGDAVPDGVEGYMGRRPESKGGGVMLVGYAGEDPSRRAAPNDLPEPNAPVEVRANAFVVSASTTLLEVDQGWTGERYMLAGEPFLTLDGQWLAPLYPGPEYIPTLRDFAIDTRELDVTDTRVQVVSMTLANSYNDPNNTQFQYKVRLNERGGRTTIFTVHFVVDGTDTYSFDVSLNGAQNYFVDTLPISSPLTAGQVVRMDVSAVSTHVQSDGWVEGHLQESYIEVRQG